MHNIKELLPEVPLQLNTIVTEAGKAISACKELLPETPGQLNPIVQGAGAVTFVYGVYSIGKILIAGALATGLGSIQGLMIVTPSRDSASPKNSIDSCFNAIENTGIFIVRRSMAVLREGFKGAVSGIAHESKAVMWPWYSFYKSCTPRHDSLAQVTDSRAALIEAQTSPELLENMDEQNGFALQRPDSTDTVTSIESLNKDESDELGFDEVYDRLRKTPSISAGVI